MKNPVNGTDYGNQDLKLGKRSEIHITLDNAATPTQLHALLVSPSRSGAW